MITMETDSSTIQPFWNSTQFSNYELLDGAVKNSADFITSQINDPKDSFRIPYSSNIDFLGAAAMSLSRIEDESVIPLVGSVHHHYPNHSSVKAIHPNSQIFRSCYPDTPYSTGDGHDILPGRHESGLEWPSTPHDITAIDESSRENPFFPTIPLYLQNSLQQSKQGQIGQNRCCANCSSTNSFTSSKMESRYSIVDNNVCDPSKPVNNPQNGLPFEGSDGTIRDSPAIHSFNSPKAHPHSEFFRSPTLYQRCCAYHPQNKEKHRELGIASHSNSSDVARGGESVFKFPEKRNEGGEIYEEKMTSGRRAGEFGDLDAEGMKEVREKEDIQHLLLQEQVRVLLWALLGSERLSSAARVAECGDNTNCTCWNEMPVRDLLSALIGLCGCSDCRPRRSFYELAYSLLNMCPPLSERLAGGGPEVLTQVVASVYHNDLMPSIRKHGDHFPEGVHNSVVQVARLEMKLDKISQEKPLPPTINSESQPSKLVELEKIHERGKALDSKEETEFLKMEIERSKDLNPMETEDKNNLEHETIKKPKSWLHPHQQLVADELDNSTSHCNQTDSSLESKYAHRLENDTHAQEDKKIQTDVRDKPIHGHVPVLKRKRGRPPKNGGQSINAKPRKKRTLLWKFLITILDEIEGNQKTSSPYHQKPQNLSDLKQKEHLRAHDDQQSDLEINTKGTTNKTHSEDNYSRCLRWISREDGIFRILDTTELARKWGHQHKNPNMTYEKMSRAMRTYYQRKVLVPVPRSYNLPKKLVYKFNPLLLIHMSSKLIKNK